MINLWIYTTIILSIIFIAFYNQRVYIKAIKDKKKMLVFLPGIIEGLLFLFSNSGILVPLVYIGMLKVHLKNYVEAQELNKEESTWIKKNLLIRILLLSLIYYPIAIFVMLVS